MALSVAKTHGSRNDIFVVDGSPDDHFASAAEVERAVTRLCDPGSGLGGDGVYFVADEAGDADGGARAWFFNPDGSPSLLCGNGMRCAGRLLLDRRQSRSVVVRTGPYAFTVRDAGLTAHGVRQVAVELPPVDFTPAEPIVADVAWPLVDRELPVLGRRVTALAVPNSHLVSLVDAYREEELVAAGELVAATPGAFPLGANLSFVLPLRPEQGGSADAEGLEEVFVRTYERGAGLTPSCGSGIVASRAVLTRLGLVEPGRPVLVRNVGGVARSWLEPTGVPVLEGNATLVYRVELDAAALLGEEPLAAVAAAAGVEAHQAEVDAFAALSEENAKALRESGIRTAYTG
ncbi:diaminopimelate epimerase [Streptomyces sp. 4N509B]|uniref:diaminopimelate epimerase n=1 Tax=Streptomyces sp. 4N509B TaxID=3457413 RepID=UPI003FD548AD